jgi:tetratricopeptide (TPR) repeat protein
MDAWRHHLGAALDDSNGASKNTEKRTTKEISESPKRVEWPRRKPLENTRKSIAAPTPPSSEVTASRSKANARSLEKQGDRERTSLSRRVERKKKDVDSISPARRNLRDPNTTRSTSLSPPPPKGQRNPRLAKVERLANLAYKEGKYTVAHDLYTTAIEAYTSGGTTTDVDKELIARLYGNRAAVCLKQRIFGACVEDCDAALSFNQRLYRAYLRKAWALNEMGLFAEACVAVSAGLKDNPGTLELEKELANCKTLRMKFALVQSFLDVKKYEEAHELLAETQSSLRYAVFLQCKAELGLGEADKALRTLNLDIFQNDLIGGDVVELVAEAHFQNGDLDKAILEARKAQGCSPDCSQKSARLQLYQDVHSLMLTAQIAAKERRFAKVVEACSSAIIKCGVVLPLKAVLLQKLYLLRSGAYLQAEELPQCLDDTAFVIALDDTCAEAWTTRVKALQGMRKYDLIAKELSIVVAKLDDAFLKSAYENALGQPASIDLYELFGVSRDASVEEIMKQFQIKVAEVQPENFEGEEITETQRREMEQKRAHLEKGISILCDSFQRSQYDAGKRVDSIRTSTDALCRSAKSA